ncbi:MAG: VOC family protein [Solirubrobacterales bacterium]|nr:VOC family protein [Solirubrobacterales bacterium]
MTATSSNLPRGFAGLQYPITQVSLAVRDLEQTMERYWRTFGWSGWDVFDHKPPAHHNTELRGEHVDYTLKGAEVMVGSLNFELLEPVDGPSLWKEFIDQRGEGVASIAVMFKTSDEGEAVKREFAGRGMPVTMKANIGDHIEYYYLDTQERFGCLIESGSGHAADFVSPAYVYPTSDAPPSDKPAGLYYGITQVSVVVRDLDARMRAYHDALGWGPWKVFESDGEVIMHDCELDGRPVDYFDIRWAETQVGDLNFELIEPRSGDNPWQRMLDTKGEGIGSIAVMFKTREQSQQVTDQFAAMGRGITARAGIGDHIEWYYLDTEPDFKCVIESGSGHALDFMKPAAIYPEPAA